MKNGGFELNNYETRKDKEKIVNLLRESPTF